MILKPKESPKNIVSELQPRRNKVKKFAVKKEREVFSTLRQQDGSIPIASIWYYLW